MCLSTGTAGGAGSGGVFFCGSVRAFPMIPAVFIDRDGTIIEDRDYLQHPEGVTFIPGAAKALRLFDKLGLPVVLISNQSGIGRGIISEQQHAQVHEAFLLQLRHHGCYVDASYYCPHKPDDGCACRKPNPGLLHEAAFDLGLSLSASFMIGDRLSDIEAGRRAGCRSALVLTGRGRDTLECLQPWQTPDFVGDDLLAVAFWIKRELGQNTSTKASNSHSSH